LSVFLVRFFSRRFMASTANRVGQRRQIPHKAQVIEKSGSDRSVGTHHDETQQHCQSQVQLG
jgi:hypothetical protein